MRVRRLFYSAEGGGGAPAPGAGGGSGEALKTVAYENFQAVVTAKNGLEAQVAQLRGELQKATERGATVDTLSAQVNEWKGKAEQASGRFAAFTELSGALGSTDSDVIDAFEGRYCALPQKDRPDRKAWVETLKAKPDEAPALLRPWLTAGQGGTQAAGAPKPKVPGAAASPPGAPATFTAEQIAAVREEAVRTGNWTKWKEMSVAMGIRPKT